MEPEQSLTFGSWLKERRKALDLTQRELAELAGCSLQSIRKIESDERRPSKQVAELLARHLDLAPEEQSAFLQFARGQSELQRSRPLPQLPRPRHSHSNVEEKGLETEASTSLLPLARLPAGNLPPSLTSFIGRKVDIQRVRSLLWRTDVRLLTLVGAPGIGKTRLAIEVASSLISDFSGGVFFVPLDAVSDPDLLLPAFAETLDVELLPGQSAFDALLAWIQDKNLMLVADNFEQLVSAAPLLGKLLARSPGLKVLATSRLPLRLYGEHEFPVHPLSLPPSSIQGQRLVQADPAQLGEYEAVQLFTRRAQAANPDFSLTQENALAVAEICRKLDGLPLAIELAASRVKYYRPSTLLARLTKELSAKGPQDVPPRQRTLHGAITWSYYLLDNSEQRLFRRAGLFVGGVHPADMSALGRNLGDSLTEAGTLDILLSLANKSLLSAVESPGQPDGSDGSDGSLRFLTLMTMREYALETLASLNEEKATQQAYAQTFLALAEQAEPHMSSSDQAIWLSRLDAEHDNIRAALQWFLDQDDTSQLALRMSGVLWRFWYIRGYLSEGRRWLQLALDKDEANDSEREAEHMLLRAKALYGLGGLAIVQTDYGVARATLEESLSIRRQAGDKHGVSNSLVNLGLMAQYQGDFVSARSYLEESLEIKRELNDLAGMSPTLNNLGEIAYQEQDYASAERFHLQNLEVAHQLQSEGSFGYAYGNLGMIALKLGNLEAARAYHLDALEIFRKLGDKGSIAWQTQNLGSVALCKKELPDAGKLLREALSLYDELGDKRSSVECFEELAVLSAQQSNPERALRLFSVAQAVRTALNIELPSSYRPYYDDQIDLAGAMLDKIAQEKAWSEGAAMTFEKAVEYALSID